MARCHRRHKHGRYLRVDRAFVLATQGESRSVLAPVLPIDRQQALARRQCAEKVRQWPAFRAASIRNAVFPARIRNEKQSGGRMVTPAPSYSPGAGSRLGQTENADTLALRNARIDRKSTRLNSSHEW